MRSCWFHPHQEGTVVTAHSGAFSSPQKREVSPLRFMLSWNCSRYKWEEIGVILSFWSDSASNKYRLNGKFTFMQKRQCFNTIIWLFGLVSHALLDWQWNFFWGGPIWTHGDAFVLAADSHVVAFPEHAGLRMSTWRHTLQHRRLAGGHHHIAGCLPKIVSQD